MTYHSIASIAGMGVAHEIKTKKSYTTPESRKAFEIPDHDVDEIKKCFLGGESQKSLAKRLIPRYTSKTKKITQIALERALKRMREREGIKL